MKQFWLKRDFRRIMDSKTSEFLYFIVPCALYRVWLERFRMHTILQSIPS